MIFRTLLFFVLMYFLVKIISRLFLPSKPGNKSGGSRSFYRTFQQFADQNHQYNQSRQQPDNGSQRFEEIEEAEFEDITEEEKSTGNTPE